MVPVTLTLPGMERTLRVVKREIRQAPASGSSRGDPVVLIGGWYDSFRKSGLQAELSQIKPHSDVVLDLSRTEHLDCACLGILIKNLNGWRGNAPGARLRLVNVAPRTQRILEILELDRIFVIEKTAR